MKSIPKLALTLLTVAALLSACGIKPGRLTPPNGNTEDDFPHDYPRGPVSTTPKEITDK